MTGKYSGKSKFNIIADLVSIPPANDFSLTFFENVQKKINFNDKNSSNG